MSSSSSRAADSIIYSHTGLRGIAAMSVFIAHIFLMESTAWDLNYGFFRFFMWQNYAVDLFFILSGFILNWVYLSETMTIKWSSYLRARVGRIMPLYYLTTSLYLPLLFYRTFKHEHVYEGLAWPITLFSNLFMVSGIMDGGKFTLNSPAWSIGVEFFCYLAVFPVLMQVYRFLSTHRWFVSHRLLFSIILVCLFSHGLVLCYQFTPISIYNWHWDSSWLGRGIFGFSIGFFLCIIFRLSSQWRPNVILINVVVIGVITFFLLSRMNYLPEYPLLYAFPFLVYFTAFDRGLTASILKLNVFQWMGERSYSIYLWHKMLLHSLASLSIIICRHLKIPNPIGLINSILLIIIVLLISELSYRYFETPCRKLIRNLGRVKKADI